MHTISILGCGWLGFELAQTLSQKDHYTIKASTSTLQKIALFKEESLIPFLININNLETADYILSDFLECDVLIIAIPPKKENIHYLTFFKKLMRHHKIIFIKQIIFISSTSVYPNIEKNLTENEPITEENSSKRIIYQAEQLFKKHLILRCAGLMGYDRVAGKYFSNKTVDSKNDRVNYVHRDDVIEIIRLLIKKGIRNNIYNLCSPHHPTKEEVYLENSKRHAFKKSLFRDTKTRKKRIINGSKITIELEYDYIYQNPLYFI